MTGLAPLKFSPEPGIFSRVSGQNSNDLQPGKGIIATPLGNGAFLGRKWGFL